MWLYVPAALSNERAFAPQHARCTTTLYETKRNSSRRLLHGSGGVKADDFALRVRALRLTRARLTSTSAMFARRRAAPLLPLLLLLLLVPGVAQGTSEAHISEQPVPAADDSGQGVDARNSVVGISVNGVEPEVRQQSFRWPVLLRPKLRVAVVASQALHTELGGQSAVAEALAEEAPPSVLEQECARRRSLLLASA